MDLYIFILYCHVYWGQIAQKTKTISLREEIYFESNNSLTILGYINLKLLDVLSVNFPLNNGQDLREIVQWLRVYTILAQEFCSWHL